MMHRRVLVLPVLVVLLVVGYRAVGQTPQYSKAPQGTLSSAAPINQAAAKSQLMYPPSCFQPAPAAGSITKIYMRNFAAGGTGTYTNFQVNFLQTTDTAFTSTTFYTGLTPALTAASFTVTGNPTAGGWFEIPLTNPFPYNPTQSLVVEIQYSAKTGGINTTYLNAATGNNKRLQSTTITSPTGTLAVVWHDFGMDILQTPCNPGSVTAGTATASPASTVCAGMPLTLSLSGASSGLNQTYQWESAPQVAGNPGAYAAIGSSTTSPSFSTTATTTQYYRAAITCGTTTVFSQPVLAVVNPSLAGGTYTINNAQPTAGTNYNTFTDAVTAMTCGITGPVVFDVAANTTPYNEQIILQQINGASATNTVTFAGNGATLNFNATNASQRAAITLDGADYIRIRRLNIVSTGTTNGYGVQMINSADNNVVDSCNITLDTTATTTTWGGIIISGSLTGPTTAGSGSDSTTITNNVINGGTYGITLLGAAAQVSTGNVIARNDIQNPYTYGVYMAYTKGTVLEANDISRLGRSAIPASVYGIYLLDSTLTLRVTRNRIHDLSAGVVSSTAGLYGIYHSDADATAAAPCEVSNNLIYNFKNQGINYGLYNSSSNYIKYYHNTISLDDVTSASTAVTRGFYQTTASPGIELKNNIISVSRGGTGIKYAVYFNTTIAAANAYSARNNVYYLTNPGAGGTAYYNGTTYPTLSAYQSASQQDTGTVPFNPLFTSITGNDYTPATAAVSNIGVPLPQVPIDIFGTMRSATAPDPGAIEFNFQPCTSPPVVGTTTASSGLYTCIGNTVTFGLSSNTPGGGQTYQLETSTSIGGPYATVGAASLAPSATASVNATGYYRLAVTCGSTTVYSTPVLVTAYGVLPGGTYTINNTQPTAGANFSSFAEAAASVSCGISGPVVFNVANNATPYNEQFALPNIAGTSSTNTITFNGNGATLAFNANSSSQRATILFNGADWIRVKRLNIAATGTVSGVGIQMIADANNNMVDSCVISVDSSATAANFAGIAISGSVTSATTTGSACDSITITNNVINGGSAGITALGIAATPITNYTIARNVVKNFYLYGMYMSYMNACTVDSNDISRPTRTVLSTFYGVYIATPSAALRITRNRIHDPAGNAPANTGSLYAVYHSAADATAAAPCEVSNNLIYNFKNQGIIWALYNSNSDHVKYYHNTISLDDAASTSTSTTRGFYQTTAAAGIELKNNIFSITRGGTGVKHAVYFNTAIAAANAYSARSNVYYVTNAGTGGGIAHYNANDYTALAAYQAVSLQDTGSADVNPVFTSIAANNYAPTSAAVNDIGVPLPQVPFDILGAARSATNPDPGVIEFVPGGCTAPPVAGTIMVSDTTVCAGTTVLFNLQGGSIGLGQTYVYESAPTAAGPYAPVSTASSFTPYSQALTATAYFRVAITCSGITSYSDTQLVTAVLPLAGGAYTINAGSPLSATNFPSFSAAVDAMQCGLTGPVVFNVVSGSGPYNEQVIIPNTIAGVSATNTITFNGNNNVLTFNSTNTNSRSGIRLDGADWITINNLTIAATGTYGFGVQLINDADHNTIRGCTIYLDSNSTSTNYAGLVMSGSLTSATGTGSGCDSNRFLNNYVSGGYYAMTSLGASTQQVSGNVMRGNTLRNYYLYGSYHSYTTGLVVDSNDFSRPTRTTITTFYGPYLTTGCINSMVSRNRIHNPCGGNIANTSQLSGVYVAADGTAGQENMVVNNLIYNFNGQGIQYGLYNSTGAYVRFLHNTVSLDDTTSTTTAVTNGLYQTGSTTGIDVRNNIFSLRRTGSGAKTGLRFVTAATTFTSNFNDVYVTGGTGTNNFGQYGAATATYANLSAWQQGTSKDTSSVEFNPQFAGGATGTNLTPTNFSVDNLAQVIGVTTDAFGNPRSTTAPDLGAIEFTAIPPCDPPTSLAAVSVTSNAAALIWGASTTNPTGYEYVVSTTNTVPTTAGTPVATQPVLLSGLASGVTYYYFVRAVCSPTNFSVWVMDSFTTCIPPAATLTATTSTTVCQGDSATLKANFGAGFTYQFFKDGVAQGTATADSVFYATQPGIYSVIVTNATGCFDTSGTVTVAVNPLPVPTVSQTSASTLTTTVFTAYQWLLGSNTIPGANAQTYTATQNGSYSVRVTDANGCVGTSSPYNLTTTSVGGQAGAAAAIQVFPNPTTGMLFIQSKTTVNATVWTMDGRKLMDVDEASQVDLRGLPSGVYILRLADVHGIMLLTERVTKLD